MLILVLDSNKDIVRYEDIYCLETLASLLKMGKNEKTLFETINKKYNIFNLFI